MNALYNPLYPPLLRGITIPVSHFIKGELLK